MPLVWVVLSFALVRHDCISEGATARLITKLSEFFSRAEARLIEIAALSS